MTKYNKKFLALTRVWGFFCYSYISIEKSTNKQYVKDF